MSGTSFASASGLRPAAAFVLIGVVLTLVGLRAGKIALVDAGDQPRNLTQLPMPPVTFDLVDAQGVPLSVAVDRLELVMSPNAMWQAHTPDRLASLLAERLGPPHTAASLLERMLPERHGGYVRVEREPLRLDLEQARRIHAWIQRGSLDENAEPARIAGMYVQTSERPGEFELVWDPVLVLSEQERTRHKARSTIDWSRKLADGLIAGIHGEALAEYVDTEEELSAERKRVWDALLPTQFKSVVKEVSPQVALSVFELLKTERVQKHQMELVRNKKRMYPPRGDAEGDPPVAVLGRWGTLDPEQARVCARRELMLPEDASCTAQQLEQLADHTRVKVYQPSPMSGVELLAQKLLRDPRLREQLSLENEQYLFLANQVPRQPAQRYFQELVPASETPRVVTSLDLGLQRVMRLELERTLAENDPVLAEAIVLELDTGRVLAVDAVDNYELSGFLPTMHTFTPGSTFKVVIMATALDEGVITPETPFKTYGGHFKIGSREIREAEGQKKELPILTAAQGLAYSINGVLVQIGLRIPAEHLHQRLLDLGYSKYPEAGLGGERRGTIPALPWKPAWAHASVSFGHELFVTLWQHAAGLATVVRGGEYLPLRLIDAVEQQGRRWPIASAVPRRVFGAQACEQVRQMMMLGAREGTGAKVYDAQLVMGTKTGTAQKVPGEVCLHAEAEHHLHHAGCVGAQACRQQLAGQKPHNGACYTSSMCIFGRLPDSAREVMVLVVVDEPRRGKKFGADVAGPAAAAILAEALGRTHGGARPPQLSPEGFVSVEAGPASASRAPQLSDQPWREVEREAR